jgi:hypothetical protein
MMGKDPRARKTWRTYRTAGGDAGLADLELFGNSSRVRRGEESDKGQIEVHCVRW